MAEGAPADDAGVSGTGQARRLARVHGEETTDPGGMPEETRQGPAEEVGATAGRTHQEVLETTVGRERAHRALNRGGPPPGPEGYYQLDEHQLADHVKGQ